MYNLCHPKILKSEFYVMNFKYLYIIFENFNYNFPIFDEICI